MRRKKSITKYFSRNRNIYLGLVGKGHNLTVLSPDIDEISTPNLHYLWSEKVYEALYDGPNPLNITELVDLTGVTAIPSMWEFCQKNAEATFNSSGFKALLNYPDGFKFDLVLFDFSCGPFLLGFLHMFNYPPVVGLSAFSIPPYVYDYLGGHRQPSYVSHFVLHYGSEMSFMERLHNHVVMAAEDLYQKFIAMPAQNKLMQEAFKLQNLPYIDSFKEKMAVALVNTHFAVQTVEPLPANIIPVGGLQIKDPNPLNQELLDFFNRSKRGVVLFSLGTNMRGDMMDSRRVNFFIEAFKKFPEHNFVWKFESELDTVIPENVKIVPWFPQNDILAHPKTKAFITHCGLLGVQEAVWYGIPIIGLPIFTDQFKNCMQAVEVGLGVQLDYLTLSTASIENGIREVLTNTKYSSIAQERSSLFRDQLEKPLDRAIFWIEWVMRHKNNYNPINLPVKKLGNFIFNSGDIITFVVGVLALFFSLLILSTVVCCFHQRTSSIGKEVKEKRH